MAENLNYDAKGGKCYDNKPANCDKYGRLYVWNATKDVCPQGWHLPSVKEWEELGVSIGNSNSKTLATKMKANRV